MNTVYRDLFAFGLIVPVPSELTNVPTSFRIYAGIVETDIVNNRYKVRISVYLGDEGTDSPRIAGECSSSLGDVGGYNSWNWSEGHFVAPNTCFIEKDFWVAPETTFSISFVGRIGINNASWNRSMSGTAKTPKLDRGLAYISNGTSYNAYGCYIHDGSNWNLHMPYIWNGSSWQLYT